MEPIHPNASPRCQRSAKTLKKAIKLMAVFLAIPPLHSQEPRPSIEGYHEFNYGQDTGGEDWIQTIRVSEPPLRSEIEGDVTVRFKATGMDTARAMCWQQPTEQDPNSWGHDENLTPDGIALDAEGNGSFVFPAGRFPNGPVNVRIFARNREGKRDIFELQLFNLGGVKWNQGLPKTDPPAAKGLELIFADDFDGPLSISNDGRNARYNAHKPRHGDFSGWPFSDVLGDGKPFAQTGTWLKIAARKDAESPQGRSGLIASVDMDGKGVWAKAPAYLECRFTAQSAPGTWPAFWTITHLDRGTAGDELDIVEAYGGMGKGNPNHPGYSIVSHFWGQKNPDGSDRKAESTVARIMELGGKSYWSTTFHTYAVSIGLEETVYYFDDIEVLRHPTNGISRDFPHCFLVNYAIGGISGWPIDLERYGNGSDMWVDYIRVYAREAVPDYAMLPPGSVPDIATPAIGLNFSIAGNSDTELNPEDTAGSPGILQTNWNNLPGPAGNAEELKDHTGKPSGASASWQAAQGEITGIAKTGREWGFQGGNLKLQRGYLQLGGSLTVSDIPYARYDVHVYINADDHGGIGKVGISSPDGGVDARGTYYYNLGWHDGTFVRAESTTRKSVKPSNSVVFSGNTAKTFILDWTGNLERGGTGVSGIQIVERPE